MADPTRRNRLDEEASPYLRQHADNPVHWQPWDDAALDAARDRDVPIFLSIGYSACHWCHVMEEESFEDPEIAAVLNDRYVPIKVDREERPDLDSVYMTVCQMVTGQGGWPLSVWLTPDREPFFVGTYFPREATAGRPGFRDLLDRLADDFETDREDVEDRADQWTAAARGELESVPDQPGETPDESVVVAAAEAALERADRQHGGFGRSPKFPQPRRIDLLFRAHRRTGREAFRDVAVETLEAMAAGGLHDHLGGGFHRYATDRTWTVPHFEKMLYDNAEIPQAYLSGYRVTGDDRFADVVRETLGFVDRELSHPDGGFYSTLDARSRPPDADPDADVDDEEGAFYVWTPDQVAAAIEDATDADLFRARYGVDDAGNFEGTTVLTLAATVDDLADEFDLSADEVESRLATARRQAFDARERRPRPARDEKVLAGWNGLVISTLAEAGLALDSSYADRGVDALSFVRDRLWDGDRLARREKAGDVKGDGYLEDYAFLARGALDCFQATGDVDHLGFALDLADAIEAEFWDADAGTLYFAPGDSDLVARPQELSDQSTPSSAGVAADTLHALSAFAPHDRFGEIAERVIATHADRIREKPLRHATLVAAADRLAVGSLELTTATDDRPLPDAWRARLGQEYVPDRLLAPRPPTEDALDAWLDALGLSEAPPIWADRTARDGDTVYVCRRACSPPLTDIEDAVEWIEDFEPGSADGG